MQHIFVTLYFRACRDYFSSDFFYDFTMLLDVQLTNGIGFFLSRDTEWNDAQNMYA